MFEWVQSLRKQMMSMDSAVDVVPTIIANGSLKMPGGRHRRRKTRRNYFLTKEGERYGT
jgi:hypothetical protein